MAIDSIKSIDESLKQRLGTDTSFPISGNFASISGLSTLLQDIQLLLLTSPGERVGRPDFGCTLRLGIWENIEQGAAQGAASIKQALDQFEPRINVTEVNYQVNRNTGLVSFRIRFAVINTDIVTNLVFPYRTSQQISAQ